MRILHFALLAPGSPQWGLRNALKAAAPEGYSEFDWYVHWARDDVPTLRQQFVEQAISFAPDVIFAQIQTPGILPGNLLDDLRRRGIKIISWCGDLRDQTPEWAIKVAPYMTLSCFSNDRDVQFLRARGHRAEFLNIGFSTEVFTPEGPKREHTPAVIFCGTNYCNRFPCSAQRQRIVAAMRQRFGERFAVYGHGWGPADPFLPEEEEAAAYRACKVALDINHYQDVERFTSDRRFRAMGCGTFVLCNPHPGIEQDFAVGEHLVAWQNEAEIPDRVDYWLSHDAERQAIAAAGCKHVHANHTWDCRIKELLGMLR